jgi:hypothetical protein
MKRSLVEKILNDVALDPRIKDGIFSIEENTHMDVLREYLVTKGIDESSALEYTNSVLEGKYPERQAYNQKGILVTFPTPEYKNRAIERGTHFEKDPTKGKPNIFGGGGQQAPQPGAPAPTPAPETPTPQQGEPPAEPAQGQPKTNLPLSQAGGAEPPQSDTPDKSQPETPPATIAAPQQVQTPQQPVIEPEEPSPPPPPPSPAEKEANKDAIKKMLKGDDYMLEEAVNLLMEASEIKPYVKDGRDFTLSIKAKRLITEMLKRL